MKSSAGFRIELADQVTRVIILPCIRIDPQRNGEGIAAELQRPGGGDFDVLAAPVEARRRHRRFPFLECRTVIVAMESLFSRILGITGQFPPDGRSIGGSHGPDDGHCQRESPDNCGLATDHVESLSPECWNTAMRWYMN